MKVEIEDLIRLLPRASIRRIMALEGPVLRRVADNEIGHSLIRKISHGGLGRLSIRIARRLNLVEDRNPIEVAMAIMRYYFEPLIEEEKINDSEAVFHLTSCPYGWCTEKDVPLCDSVMEFERELVSGIGATLEIEQTIPGGAPQCRFTIRANRS